MNLALMAATATKWSIISLFTLPTLTDFLFTPGWGKFMRGFMGGFMGGQGWPGVVKRGQGLVKGG